MEDTPEQAALRARVLGEGCVLSEEERGVIKARLQEMAPNGA